MVAATGEEYWFAGELSNEARAQALSKTVDSIIDRHVARWAAYERFASLYRGYDGGLSCKYASADGSAALAPISLNAIKSCVDTVVSKVAVKNRPKPMLVPNAADFDTRMLAKDAELFANGVLFHAKAYNSAERAFQDAAIFGEGFVKTYAEGGRIVIPALHPWEALIDEAEGRFGEPPAIYHVRYIDKFSLAKTFPDFRDEIVGMSPTRDALRKAFFSDDLGVGLQALRVVEGWRNGERRTLIVNDLVLEDDKIDGKSPISKVLWGTDPVVDVFGCGIVEQAEGIQSEINGLLANISEGQHLIRGYLWLPDGVSVAAKINNDLRRIMQGGERPPQYVVPQIIAPEVYEHLWNLYAKVFEVTGVSQVDATGAPSEGVTSAVGQRTQQDVQTERFLKNVRNYEDLVMDIASNVIRCASEDMSVQDNSGTRLGRRIEWTKAMSDLDAEIRVYPGSMIPDSPAGKMSWGQDMLQLGADPGMVLETIGMQDTDSIMRRMLARRFVIQKNIESIIRKGKYVSPEPSDDHALALQLVNDAYHEARLDEVPQERLDMLLRYMTTSADLKARGEAPAAPDPNAAPTAPIPGADGAPPAPAPPPAA